MKTIYKYQIPLEQESWVAMPAGAIVRHVDVVASELYVWAEVDTEVVVLRDRGFAVRSTGHPIELDDSWQFLATVTDRHLGLVWHVFVFGGTK